MDHYQVLGVRPGAGIKEIELAYRGRRTQYHPDRYASESAETVGWATARMQEVNAAYSVLSDPIKREQYDAQRKAKATANAHGSGTSQAQTNPCAERALRISWAEYLAGSVVPQLSMPRAFCAPNIPSRKLDGALRTYGRGLSHEEVTLLVDDTVWGGAERGLLITKNEMWCCDRTSEWRMPLEEIQAIRGQGQSVVLGQRTRGAHFDLQEPRGLACILATLSGYLECTRHQAGSANENDLDKAQQECVVKICRQQMGPEAFSGSAGCHVGLEIPEPTKRMVRFILGLPAPEKLLAVCVLSLQALTEAFAVTSRGMHTRTDEGRTFLSWSSLRRLGSPSEFVKGLRCGVKFGNANALLCSPLRVDGQTFGPALVLNCVSALRT